MTIKAKDDVIKLPWTDSSIREIKDNLEEKVSSGGQPKFYEVFVDGKPIITRTQETARLAEIIDHIQEDTRKVTVLIYVGNSYHRKEYAYLLKKDENKRREDLEELVQAKLDEMRREKKVKKLKKKVRGLEYELEEQGKYVEKLHGKIADYESKRNTLSGVDLGKLGGTVLESLLIKNPQILNALPLGIGPHLAGIFEAKGKELAGHAEPLPASETSNSPGQFQRADTAHAPALDELETFVLQTVREWKSTLNQEQIMQIVGVGQVLGLHPHLIPRTLKALEVALAPQSPQSNTGRQSSPVQESSESNNPDDQIE